MSNASDMKPEIGRTAPVQTPCTFQDLGIGMVVQEWCLCPYEWGVEDHIIIESNQGPLVLCNVTYGHERGYKPNCYGIKAKLVVKDIQPLLRQDLESF